MSSNRGLSIDLKNFNVAWFFRKKKIDASSLDSSQLQRCLGLLELTALGIGSTLGAGIYVVTPDSTRQYGGPAMCISFVIAAVASVLSGLCYAELGARIPRAGSAYVYSYVAVGELWAFIVGWNMILEYVIGTASVARAAVTYIDVLANGILEQTFRAYLPISVSFLGQYFDPIAFGITMLLTILLAMGVRESTFVNNLLVIINSGILVYVIVVGFVYANPSNWTLTVEQVQVATNTTDTTFGTGGFMPYGFGGVMTAASAAFYSFVGFDCIATTGEEVDNPRRNIPLSIVLSLTVCAVAYICVSIVFTLDTPYYELSSKTLLPEVPYGSIIVSIGAILCASTSLLGGMFPLPRVIYAMAEDGLIFRFLANINKKLKTPFIATILSGFLTAVFAALFDVSQLVNMLSIGTLMAYSLVAASVLVLRYKESFMDIVEEENDFDAVETMSGHNRGDNDLVCTTDDDPLVDAAIKGGSIKYYAKKLMVFRSETKRATPLTSMLAKILASITAVTVLLTVLFAMILVVFAPNQIWPILLIVVFAAISTLLVIRMYFLPQNTKFSTFQVPGVPALPILALAVNFYLLVSLDSNTWIRFGVWMAIGFVIYFGYGIWASSERVFADHVTGAITVAVPADSDGGIEAAVSPNSNRRSYVDGKEVRAATSSFSSGHGSHQGGESPPRETTPVFREQHSS